MNKKIREDIDKFMKEMHKSDDEIVTIPITATIAARQSGMSFFSNQIASRYYHKKNKESEA